jgi:hypothetical protein
MTERSDALPDRALDDGESVGADDVRQDERRASEGGDVDPDAIDDRDVLGDDEELLIRGAAEEGTDSGVPVGAADVDEDRRRAADDV